MSRTSSFVSSGLAVVLLAAMTLVLGACGRKGGLDLPPSASVAQQDDASLESKDTVLQQDGRHNSGNPSDRSQYAPKGPKKRIILDSILD